MKKIKYLILVFFLFREVQELKSQLSIEENNKAHRRYWFYRTRMINDFMKIGANQGDCIVFPQRSHLNLYDSENHNLGGSDPIHSAKIGPDQIDITNQYLTALALEYKLLERSNQNTDETLKEIFYLLYTINRLDMGAEQFWRSGPWPQTLSTNDLNGCLLREDMPRQYIADNIKHFNYGLNEDSNLNTGYTGIEYITGLSYDNHYSNIIYFPPADPINPTFIPSVKITCPHDKYYSMFIAFMALIKYLPDGITYSENGNVQIFQDGLTDIKTEIRAITHRCHNYLKGVVFGNQNLDWITRYPDGGMTQNLGNPLLYSWAVNKMVCNIDAGYPWPNFPNCLGHQDGLSSSAGIVAFDVLQAITTAMGDDPAVFLANCQAGSNTPLVLVPEWIAMDANCSANSVEWAELLRTVLHEDGGLMKQLSAFSSPISSSPTNGPWNFGNGDYDEFEWSSQDRLEHQSCKGIGNGAPSGRYPGVDYMLLHNLYYEYLNQLEDADHEDGERSYTYNMMDNYDEQIWPRNIHSESQMSNTTLDILEGINDNNSSTTITYGPPPGYNQQTNVVFRMPANVKVFQNLSSSAKIYATSSPAAPNNTTPSKVVYRAGKEIKLLPGFEVKSGGGFNAYIQRYVGWGTSDYESGMRSANNQSSGSYNYDSDTINAYAPIHNVYSPQAYYAKTESSIVDLKENKNTEQQIKVFPNPGTGKYVLTTSYEGDYKIDIYNTVGLLINSFYLKGNEQQINIENLSPGIYNFVIRQENGITQSLKVIKE